MNPIYELFDKIPQLLIPAKSFLELELRFLVDSRRHYEVPTKLYSIDQTISIAKNLITRNKDKPSFVEQSINFLNKDRVKQLVFVRGEQQKDKQMHYEKTRLIEPAYFVHNDLPAFRLNLNYETKIDDFPVKDATSARIRLRYAITLDDWRIDITLIKLIDSFSNPAILVDAKKSMLFAIEPSNFIEKAPWKLADIIEFELEYIADYKTISINKLEIANTLFSFLSENTSTTESSNSQYQSVLYQVAKYIKPARAERFRKSDGMKQLSNQPIELDKNTYLRELSNNMLNYFITDKVDGKRAIIYISIDASYALTDKIDELPLKGSYTYIFDSEFYEGVYYIFDIMVWRDDVIVHSPFEERLNNFSLIADEFRSDILKLKPFIRLSESFGKEIADFKKEKKPYEVDGVILTPANGQYDKMLVYKYKPIEHLTIDFLIKKCPDKLLGIRPYTPDTGNTLYILFCGIRVGVYLKLGMRVINRYNDMFEGIDYNHLPAYFPIQFQPSDNMYAYIYQDKNDSLDGEVGEFTYTNKWNLKRIREDRRIEVARGNFFGNNYKIAEFAWLSYKNPLVIEDLARQSNNSYFQRQDNPLQKKSRNCNRFVVSSIFDQFKNTTWVMDIASGNGQDLFRYGKIGTRNLICLEIDKDALMELTYRKHEFGNITDRNRMFIQTHQMDMLNDYKQNISILSQINIPNTGVDLVVCNFAFHYFLESKKTLLNVAKFLQNYIKVGGRFIFTAFDGKEVIRLLNEHNGNYVAETDVDGVSTIAYGIKKQYEVNFLDSIGQKIDVLLPFSNLQYYSEYLVNIDYIAGEFAKLGFVLEIDQGFSEFLPAYKKNNLAGYNSMSTADKIWVGLYHYYCLYRQK